MPKRFQILMVLASWCLASGVQWDLLQAFAWTRMFATYAKEQSLGRALASTFAPENVCELCSVAQHGKKAQEEQPVLRSEAIKFVATAGGRSDVVVARCPLGDWPPGIVLWHTTHREPPPLPPPRWA